jgi:hypothetical protein
VAPLTGVRFPLRAPFPDFFYANPVIEKGERTNNQPKDLLFDEGHSEDSFEVHNHGKANLGNHTRASGA